MRDFVHTILYIRTIIYYQRFNLKLLYIQFLFLLLHVQRGGNMHISLFFVHRYVPIYRLHTFQHTNI